MKDLQEKAMEYAVSHCDYAYGCPVDSSDCDGCPWAKYGLKDRYYNAFIAGANSQRSEITALREALEEATRWIDAEDSPPEYEGVYLCMWQASSPEFTELYVLAYRDGGWWHADEYGDAEDNVSHWRVLESHKSKQLLEQYEEKK